MLAGRFWCLLLCTLSVLACFSASLKAGGVRSLMKARRGFTQVNSMGSDSLQRPEDEDSPEYQQYLRQLLQLQATRGKSGFSAPSSGSADAYIAKLNRLKVEKRMLEEAGVVVTDLDMSYKPEDFEQAKVEAQEPLISNSVLTGDAAIPKAGPRQNNNKLRPLTAEEEETKRVALEKVAAALERQRNLAPAELAALEAKKAAMAAARPQPQVKVRVDDPRSAALIDGLLGKVSPGNTAKAVLQPTEPLHSHPPSAVFSAVQVRDDSGGGGGGGGARYPPGGSVGGYNYPPGGGSSGRPLSVQDMEVAARALQGLVKHRGGGPFGAGRLQGEAASAVAVDLQAALDMLTRDARSSAAPAPAPAHAPARASQGGSTKQPAPSSSSSSSMVEDIKRMNSDERRLPRIPTTTTTTTTTAFASFAAGSHSSSSSSSNSRAAAAAAASPQPVSRAAPTAPPLSGSAGTQEVPIGVGLNQYLADKKSLSKGELVSLRDGLIQVLALLSGDISVRPDDTTAAAGDGGSGGGGGGQMSPSLGSSIADAVAGMSTQATARIAASMDNTASSSSSSSKSSSSTSTSSSVDKEVKLALSLLLKHRGGPGFGHGRLTGSELGLLETKLRGVADLLVDEARGNS